MALSKTKNIEEIDDVSDMFEAMAALGISCKGLKNVEQMKERARKELNQAQNEPNWTAGQVSAGSCSQSSVTH